MSKITDIIDFDQNYYEILGISPDDLPTGKDPSSKRLANQVLQQAYHKQLFKYHPDRPDGDAEKCKLVIKAHKILSDPILRNVYENGDEENGSIINKGMNINWDRLGKYRKGSLADMIGSAIFDKILSNIENISVKFQPTDETIHNYHWEFIIDGLPKELVLSIVEDETEVLKLTSGDHNTINNSLPFKIYICLPSIKLVLVREDSEFIETEHGYLDIARGKIQNAQFIDADLLGTTNYENAINFIESGGLKEAIEECINGNIDKFLKHFKQDDNIAINNLIKQQDAYKKDQAQLKELLEKANKINV